MKAISSVKCVNVELCSHTVSEYIVELVYAFEKKSSSSNNTHVNHWVNRRFVVYQPKNILNLYNNTV